MKRLNKEIIDFYHEHLIELYNQKGIDYRLYNYASLIKDMVMKNYTKESREDILKYDGVSNIPAVKKDAEGRTYEKERKLTTDDEFQQKIIDLLRYNQISATLEGIKYNLALPDKLEDFLFNFIDVNKSGRMKNEMKFKRRIMGLTSYFRSAQENLLPRFNK